MSNEWDEVERYASALEDYTRSEPLPWSDYFVGWGRALSAWGRGRHDSELLTNLECLREQAQSLNLSSALPAINRALSTV